MKRLLLFFMLIIFSACAYSQQVEDWIYLKDGTVVKGLITEFNVAVIDIKTADSGMLHYRLSQIDSVVKHNPALMEKTPYNQTAQGSFKISGSFSYIGSSYDEGYKPAATGWWDPTTSTYIIPAQPVSPLYSKASENFGQSLQISASVMYFLIDDFGAGAVLNLEGYGKNSVDIASSIGIAAQYYFFSGWARPFLNAEALHTNYKGKGGSQYAGGIGLNLAMGRNVACQPLAQYGKGSFAGSDSKEIVLYSFGLTYFIGGEK